MVDFASNQRLASFLKRYLVQYEPTNPKVKNVKFCSSSIIKQLGTIPAVFLLSNQKDTTKFYGSVSCHSAWSCPKCTPEVMAQYGARIACGIDALAKQQKLRAFMITFTIPHSNKVIASTSMNLLKKTWRYFSRDMHARKKEYTLKKDLSEDKRARGKKGEVRTYSICINPFSKFVNVFNIQYYVLVYEFTWSPINGWHPHIHALFWADKKYFPAIALAEDVLAEYWWKSIKQIALKELNKKLPDDKIKNKQRIDSYYADWRKVAVDGHKALYISKNSDGSVQVKKSSYYISGWSGDYELTHQVSKQKHAKEGHFTPFELLIESYNNATKRSEYMDAYIEYMEATYAKRRVTFSHGLNEIIEQWKKTTTYITMCKKKFMDRAKEIKKLKVVYWFTELQWKIICRLDMTTDEEIKAELLELALLPRPREKIEEYLTALNIPLNENLMFGMLREIDIIENKIFNNGILNELSRQAS